jgi:hypothetical protein
VDAAVALSLILVGCEPHQQLNAPPATASEAERLAAYGKLQPLSMHSTDITYLRGGVAVGHEREVDYLQIADGRRVYHAEDILPVVAEDSPAATAAKRSSSKRQLGDALYWGGVAALTAGAVLFLTPLFLEDDEQTGEPSFNPPLALSGGLMLGGGALIIIAKLPSRSGHDEAQTAFETYEPALRKKLNLCVIEGVLVACPE